MKKILVTGANSYIGTSFEKYLIENYPNDYAIDTIDMIDGSWREKSFVGYDFIFHVAGIAHQRETKKNAHMYYEVNRDLAIEVAQKAKKEGVGQFVILSSMGVYGMSVGVITRNTIPKPKTHYGKSKLEADEMVRRLHDDHFSVCIIRPPMVYGKGCKGNFNLILKIVKLSPIFPFVKNQRSMIYIDNLSSFVKMCMDKNISGIFCPQNREYVSTMGMASGIAVAMGKKIYFGRLAGICVRVLRPFVSLVKKGFGSLVYKDVEDFNYSYVVVETQDSYSRSV